MTWTRSKTIWIYSTRIRWTIHWFWTTL